MPPPLVKRVTGVVPLIEGNNLVMSVSLPKAHAAQRRSTRAGLGLRLTADTVRDIRHIYAALRDNPTDDDGNPIGQTELKRHIGQQFDPPVSHMTVHNIVTGQSHRTVDGPVFPSTRAGSVDRARTVVTLTRPDGSAAEHIVMPTGWGVRCTTVAADDVADVIGDDARVRNMSRIDAGRASSKDRGA